METLAISFVTMLLCLVGGGGNELLDFVPADRYWEGKGVAITAEAMSAELSAPAPAAAVDLLPLVAKLSSPDAKTRDDASAGIRAVGPAALTVLRDLATKPNPEVASRARALVSQINADLRPLRVRRLMAIRTLGELKAANALPTLRSVQGSTEPFVADYAAAAIARIEGRNLEPRLPNEAIGNDLWLLSSDCAAVGQLIARRTSLSAIEKALAAARADPAVQKSDTIPLLNQHILTLAERIGNVRVDSITFGVSDNISDASGYVAVIVRGQYDAAGARALARDARVSATRVRDLEVFQQDGESAMLFPSDEQFVFLASPTGIDLPLQATIAALQSGAGTLRSAPAEMLKQIETADKAGMLWAAVRVVPPYRKVPGLGAFDTVHLTGTLDKDLLRLKARGAGSDARRARAVAAELNNRAKQMAEFLKGLTSLAPIIQIAVNFLETVDASSTGSAATLTAQLNVSPAAVLSLPMMIDLPEPDEPAR